jgi:dTDP-4-dehydrorhamnose reductase
VKALITGSGGQVGRALAAAAPASVDVLALNHHDLDIGDAASVAACLDRFAPDVILNAAAYTAVDKAEQEPDAAKRVNETGALNLARAVRASGRCRLIHVSTDFVFDGNSALPYTPDSPVRPLGVYGQTKLDGERRVRDELGDAAVILRTSWVYDAAGRNFLRTMLRLMKERGSVRVVADQVGTPTAAHSVADVLWRLAQAPTVSGVFHWSDAGVASWYDFAVAIAEDAATMGLLPTTVEVAPIATAEYPTPARRPAFSVLDKRATVAALAITPVHWRRNLRGVIGALSRMIGEEASA